MAGGWHKFKAPIYGKAYLFSMRCEDGEPKRLYCVDPQQSWVDALEKIPPQLDVINKLLHRGLAWDAIRQQHQGDIGAVIEAAEARRAEIYDRQVA